MTAPGVGPSVRALQYWERRQEVVANNLANASTPGFKGARVFSRLLEDGGPTAEVRDDLRGGPLAETGRPLDLALEGDGFLVVEGEEGERYVRGGSLSLDPTGQLVTPDGWKVLGEGGGIVLPPGQVSVALDGTVRVDGAEVGRLRVERPSSPPVREGEGRWAPSGQGEAVPREEVRLRQGQLEESNVDPVAALVEMIEIQRAYGAIQRSLQAHDSVMQTIVGDVGRVGG